MKVKLVIKGNTVINFRKNKKLCMKEKLIIALYAWILCSIYFVCWASCVCFFGFILFPFHLAVLWEADLCGTYQWLPCAHQLPDGFHQWEAPMWKQSEGGKWDKDIYFLSFLSVGLTDSHSFRQVTLSSYLFLHIPITTPSSCPFNHRCCVSFVWWALGECMILKVSLCHTHIFENSLFIKNFLQMFNWGCYVFLIGIMTNKLVK